MSLDPLNTYVPPKWENVKSKVDCKPPKLSTFKVAKPNLLNSIARETRRMDIDNIDIVNKLYQVHLTGGKTNTFWKTWPPRNMKSNLSNRQWIAQSIVKDNKMLLKNIKAVKPTMQTAKELSVEWEKNKRRIIAGRKHPATRKAEKDKVAIAAPNGDEQFITHKSSKFSDKRPRVLIEVSHEGVGRIGRMEAVLYSDYVPKTCKAFLSRCDVNNSVSYNGARFSNIFPKMFCILGDKSAGADKKKFNPIRENCSLRHAQAGLLSVNVQENLNGTQFIITFKALACMNGKYVAFGRIYKGLTLLSDIERLGTSSGSPLKTIWISNIKYEENVR